MSNVWVDLATPNPPVGGIPYINSGSEVDLDVLNLFYDSVNKMQYIKNGVTVDYTNAAVVGAQTINKAAGSVLFAAAAQTIVVTNNLITALSQIMAQIQGDDTTAKSVVISAQAAGSFTLKLNAAATAQLKVSFFILPLGTPEAQ